MSMYDSTLTPAELATYVDRLEAAGVPYVWHETAKPILDHLTYGDRCAVATLRHARQVRRAIEAFETTPAIRAYMLGAVDCGARGLQAPTACDASGFAKAAMTTRDQWGKPRKPYAPKGKCELRLCLRKAVSFGYSQEAYADYSTTLIPVAGDVSKIDVQDANANLCAFFRYADSHTGMAGSGANHSASLQVTEHGAFVIVTTRASIAD